MAYLETKDLAVGYHGKPLIEDIALHVQRGRIVTLIGPNGSGKSTFFNLITGVLTPSSGHIFYAGKEITKSRPHQVAKMGIGRTFQLNPLFGEFTVFENVAAAYHLRPHSTVPQIFFNTKTYRTNEAYIAKSADEILEFLGLQHVRNELAKNLPHGYQKILGVARALATKPKLLLLDEPLGGMNPEEIAFSIDAISKLRDKGISILVVEHNMQILDILDSVTVISFGHKIFEGTPEEMRKDPTVIETYFGGTV